MLLTAPKECLAQDVLVEISNTLYEKGELATFIFIETFLRFLSVSFVERSRTFVFR